MPRCLFCRRFGPAICTAQECINTREQAEAAYKQMQYDELRKALKATLRQWVPVGEYDRPWYARTWYVFKVLICVLLRWKYANYEEDPYPDAVVTGYHQSDQWYGGYNCKWIEVGPGITSGWWYRIEHDNESWM